MQINLSSSIIVPALEAGARLTPVLRSLRFHFARGRDLLGHRMVCLTKAGIKRLLDIVASSAALLLLAPLLLAVMIAIRLESRGPVFFFQSRVGRKGRLFQMYKFRSMRQGAARMKGELAGGFEQGGLRFKMKQDPRITRVGRFIRKYSIDELPQLWNVLRGDMTLVGPRPSVPSEVRLYTLAQRRRLLVTPGITCIWQVSGRSDIDFDGQVQLDTRYVYERTLVGDMVLLARTIPAVVSGKGAY